MISFANWFRALFVTVAALIECVTPSSGITDMSNRRAYIARTFVEAYDTARRFEEFSVKNRSADEDVLVDEKYYQITFKANTIDVRGTMVVEEIKEVSFKNIAFFRVYSGTISSPYPVYVVGVKRNGTIYRFRGFHVSDFDSMVQGVNVASNTNLMQLVALYYKLLVGLSPGPIIVEEDRREATAKIRSVDAEFQTEEEGDSVLFLPEELEESDASLVRLCVFDSDSTRLEVHRLRIGYDGRIELLDVSVIRDIYSAVY